MSTNSTIGILERDGTYTCIYCHWDGYPEHQAPILATYDEAKTRALLALGNISLLGEAVAPPDGVTHSYAQPVDGVTIAYHRDRGEPLRPARARPPRAVDEAFAYVFDVATQQWTWAHGGAPTVWRPLSERG